MTSDVLDQRKEAIESRFAADKQRTEMRYDKQIESLVRRKEAELDSILRRKENELYSCRHVQLERRGTPIQRIIPWVNRSITESNQQDKRRKDSKVNS